MKFIPLAASRRGVALVLVLSVVVLITALIVGFLLRVGSDRSSTASYSNGVAARQLGDVVVNLVQGQINDATGQGPTMAWASQPGAIRTFDNSGTLKTIYRLYSGSTLTTTQARELDKDIPPTTWSASPALWTDLNAPVTVQGVKDSSGNTVKSFPILDPRDPADPTKTVAIEGFSITGAPGATTTQPAPMPVRWLYVLKDGQIITPDATSTGNLATFNNSTPVPTTANPITGRIAFWTDDETSKVNLNTAAGSMRIDPSGAVAADGSPAVLPAPWDTPRLRIWDELRLFSEDQPTHYEYQRYPGHPATTDLYGIFHALNIPMTGYPYTTTAAYTSTSSKTAAAGNNPSDLFKLLPRYGDAYSSAAGTANTTIVQPAPAAILNNNRLYTSFGEMMYDPTRVATGVNRAQVETGKFFLTASSRAPDLTLFGTPRISMWPIDSDYGVNPTATNPTKLTSPFDKLIAFCTTTGTGSTPRQYYIQRHDSTSPTNDYTLIQRNQRLYSYLQFLTAANVPGFGGSFASKYGVNPTTGERDQILTEMVDYIRSTNVYDHANSGTDARFTPAFTALFNGFGQVVPLRINSTQGLGRTYTISEVGLHIICTADGNSPLPYQDPVSGTSPVKGSANDYRYVSNLSEAQMLRDTAGNPTGIYTGTAGYAPQTTLPYPGLARNNAINDGTFPPNPTLADTYGGTLTRLTSGQKRLQAMLLFEVQCPMQGYDAIYPKFQVRVTDLSTVSIGGSHPFAPSYPLLTSSVNRTNSWTNAGGYQQFSMCIFSNTNQGGSSPNQRANGWSGLANLGKIPPPSLATTNPAGSYWFVSKPFTVLDDDSGTTPLPISGGPFKIEIMVTPKGTSTPVVSQTFNVTFPPTSPTMPDLLQYGLVAEVLPSTTPKSYNFSAAADWWGFDNRISWAASQMSTASSTAAGSSLYWGSIMRADPPNTTPMSTSGSWTYMTSSTIPTPYYKDPNGAAGPSQPSDVVRTLIARDGDVRLVMAKSVVDSSEGAMTPTAGYNTTTKLANNFVCDAGFKYRPAGSDLAGRLVPGITYPAYLAPKVPSDVTPDKYWDWDTGFPTSIDGAYANKPDEGNNYTNSSVSSPYYQSGNNNDGNDLASQAKRASYFTANRIVPSAVMFGSLPTGVKNNIAWRTLLFRPQASDDKFHPITGPADHLFLDLFTMPVVEPYAISEPFSTAGKVNMNYQIVPFTYINRSSAVRAVLSSELIAKAPAATAATGAYKGQPSGPPASLTAPSSLMARLPLNLDETTGTLRQFADKFAGGEIFRSASEICDLYLVPKGYTWQGFASQWYDSAGDFAMVGDNVRERPYADIYPRLTTKSNTYTVHYTVQALKNLSTNPAQWSETRGSVTGEYRGSTTIERFLDPSNPRIDDYADGTDPTSKDSLEKYYQWRIVANRRFYP